MQDVENMTLAQLRAFTTSVAKWRSIDQLNMINSARVAYHADAQEYSKITGDIVRDLR